MLDLLNSLLYASLHVQVWLYARAKDARGPHSYCTNALTLGDIVARVRRGDNVWFKVH